MTVLHFGDEDNVRDVVDVIVEVVLVLEVHSADDSGGPDFSADVLFDVVDNPFGVLRCVNVEDVTIEVLSITSLRL